jgi:SAM-dependent methyltransferase
MDDYARFAAFYDDIMDDPGARADRVRTFVERYRPGAVSLLELGCGTGSILARLDLIPTVAGLDRSPQMLERARVKVPRAELFQGDMAAFSLGTRFDVVICVFDSLNHLLTLDAWQSLFAATHGHLVEDGLFIFDVNTTGELERLGNEPPWVYDFDGNVVIMDVTVGQDDLSEWDIRIFENVGESQYRLHHERIGELGVRLDQIRSTLEPHFAVLEVIGEDGEVATDDSVKAHFACRRRSSP